MSSQRGTNPFDPTDQRTADQSTQTASGPGGGTDRREEDAVARERPSGSQVTPRRYDRDTEDPALPADDATLNTKI
jgi:hypothetical protein